MNRLTPKIRLTLSALALLGFAVLARAAQSPANLTPIKATLTGPLTPRFVIPMEPEIRLGTFTADGQSDQLGAVKLIEANTVHLTADGNLLSVTDGQAVLADANGDALFINYDGPVTSPTTAEFNFTVIGGRGKFLGATGSGVIHCAVQPDQKTFTRVVEGSAGIPK